MKTNCGNLFAYWKNLAILVKEMEKRLVSVK